MFRKLVDVLKEVFWIKPSRKGRKAPRRKLAKATARTKKPAVKPKVAPKPKKQAPAAVSKPPKTPKVKPEKKPVLDPSLTEAGEITHYFDRINVCVVKVTHGTVLIGDKLTIAGKKTKFVQKVWSMQIESEDVKVAKKGQLIGLKVDKLVAVGDKVYK